MSIYDLDLEDFVLYCATIPEHSTSTLTTFITEEVEREEACRAAYEYMQWGIYAEQEEEPFID